MNYKNIYDQFIADRRLKEAALLASGEYFERHHVIPRSMGGDNSKGNLICLSFEDHLRAHLLLARAFGGNQWIPLRIMIGNKNKTITRFQRKFYLMVKTKSRIANLGEANPFYGKKHTLETLKKLQDKNIYFLIHKNNGEISGTQKELQQKTGLTARAINSLITGSKLSYLGWYDKAKNPDMPTAHESVKNYWRKKQNLITLYHLDGRVWNGYPVDAPIALAALNNQKNKHQDGWFLCEKERNDYPDYLKRKAQHAADMRGCILGKNNPRADLTVYLWKKIESGEIVKSTRIDMWEKGLTKSGIKDVFSGRQKQTGGWLFLGAAN